MHGGGRVWGRVVDGGEGEGVDWGGWVGLGVGWNFHLSTGGLLN